MPCFSEKIITDYVVFDLETTGLSPDSDSIIEIAAVKVINDRPADTFSSFVDPHRRIPEFITDITGITNKMVKGAPPAEEIVPAFIDFCGGLPVLGHNINKFDMRFINAVQRDFSPFSVDTLDLSEHIRTGGTGNSLSSLCLRFNVINDNAHRALSDCMATHEVYLKLKELYRKNGAYFNMAVNCGRKLFQENIAAFCKTGTKLTAQDNGKQLTVFAGENPVGTVSGGKYAEYADNASIVRKITVSGIRTNAKGKFLMGTVVFLGGE